MEGGSGDIRIRSAEEGDLRLVAELAGELVRMHNRTDPARFFLPENVEKGYAWWFSKELARPGAVILVATVPALAVPAPALAVPAGERVVGYAYGTIEERDWNMLLDAHGALHDVLVAEEHRRSGAGKLLVDAMVERLESLGAKRVVLSTMVGNAAAQKLFARCGFRATMLEMTRGG
jgi:ribosomal protein S18 acetylase RimI-like enzyme